MTSIDEVTERIRRGVREACREASRTKQQARPSPFGLSLSALGGCTRQAAYRAAGTDPSDPELGWDLEDLAAYKATRDDMPDDVVRTPSGRAALLGTWLHEGLLPHLADALSDPGDGEASYEVPVQLRAGDQEIPGTLDLIAPGLVLDLKGYGRRAPGPHPYRTHLIQVAAYGLAAWQAGADVRHVAWLYLDMATGEDRVIVQEFSPELVDLVRFRVFEVQKHAQDPDTAPRDEAGPGQSVVCDSCPWLRRCWGEFARPGRTGPQGQLARTDDQVEAALAAYHREVQRESDAKRAKERYRAIFLHGPDGDGSERPAGTYGSMRFHRGTTTEKLDVKAAEAALEAAGLPVPKRSEVGRLYVRPT